MVYVLLLLAAIGHVAFWTTLVNRVHGLGMQRKWINLATLGCAAMMAAVPLAIAALFWLKVEENAATAMVWGYLYVAAAWSLWSAVHRLYLAMHPERAGSLSTNHTTRVDPDRHSERSLTRPGFITWVSRLPGNEVLQMHLHEKRLAIPRMPAGCREIRIAHISDFHMSGRITKDFFVHIAEQVNALEPDLITITGDLVEYEPCLNWLPETLGRLHAEGGVYFVLGNHDRRVAKAGLADRVCELGLVHLGGKWEQISIGDVPIVLVGNELPWFGPAVDMSTCPPRDASGLPLRIALTHGPDQLAWAVANDVDLLLAGHNHGGQVRLPLLGAIVAPSRSGTRYAGGVFRRGNTVLHVSRGTGSLFPLRWNCPPEIALLTLSSA